MLARSEKRKQRIQIKISLVFENPIKLNSPIRFERTISKDYPDSVTINKNAAVISFERALGYSKARYLGKTRVDYLRWLLLSLACMEGTEQSPGIAAVSCSVDGKGSIELEVPHELNNALSTFNGTRYPDSVVGRSFRGDAVAKSLHIAISYSWAASRAGYPEERLKLLWGAFNALYRGYAEATGSNATNDASMLNSANQLFVEHDVLFRSLIKFDQIFNHRGYEDFVSWKLLTGTRSRSLHIANEDKKKTKLSQLDRLRYIDKESLTYMRDRGCADYQSKSLFKTKINELLPDAKSDRLRVRRVALLVCRYAYILRCDGVHANREYPIFDSDAMSKKQVLGDLLEAVTVDLATWLAANY